jgi:hypothetical protein
MGQGERKRKRRNAGAVGCPGTGVTGGSGLWTSLYGEGLGDPYTFLFSSPKGHDLQIPSNGDLADFSFR